MKYHVSKDGTPGICTAKGPCPLGGEENHFDTYQEAKDFGQEQLEKEYGILSKVAEEATPYEYVENIYEIGEDGFETEEIVDTQNVKGYLMTITVVSFATQNIRNKNVELFVDSFQVERKYPYEEFNRLIEIWTVIK